MEAERPGSSEIPPKNIKCETEEVSGRPEVNHVRHSFEVRFNQLNLKCTVSCDKPQSVLDTIKTLTAYTDKIKRPDNHITLQLGEGDKGTSIPTHFPCSLIQKDQLIIVSQTTEETEKIQDRKVPVFPEERYSVFYIQTKGGENAKTKARTKQGLFQSSAIKKFTRLCVYATKGMTVKQAVESDGRFVDLSEFGLSDIETNSVTECRQPVDDCHGKTFRIRLPMGKSKTDSETKDARDTENDPSARAEKVTGCETENDTPDVPRSRVVSVKTLCDKMREKGENTDEIYQILRRQFPELKKLMESRFPGKTLEEALEKVNFGKIQQSFNKVYLIKKLLSLGDSVCHLSGGGFEGTGFVLFDEYILTNAHVFQKKIKSGSLTIEVKAQFGYEDPQKHKPRISVEKKVIDIDSDLDYAVLKLQSRKGVPPGLMSHFGPKPENGEACIIGHDDGKEKKMDHISIIEKENREEAMNKELEPFNRTMAAITQKVDDLSLDNIMSSDEVITYDTFMYHGSSGSPLFDAQCRVVGLHSAAFEYRKKHPIIRFAQPVLDIFRKFVTNLKKDKKEFILQTVKTNVKRNQELSEILKECDI